MPYDAALDQRIQTVIAEWKHIERKKMFGGTCYLHNGHMFCGVYKEYLILRLGEGAAREAMGRPHVKPMDITGRPMKGWVMVAPEGYSEAADLAAWLERAKSLATALPSKK